MSPSVRYPAKRLEGSAGKDPKNTGTGGGGTGSADGRSTGPTDAVIIDDIGFDLRIVEELAGIPAPIAFAVLPHTPMP